MRLIDADALKRECEKLPRVLDDEFIHFVKVKDITKTINNAPTIEAEPVRHGEWIEPEEYTGHTEWHCSYCGDVVYTICGYPSADYCPNCGAKMEGKNEDGVD